METASNTPRVAIAIPAYRAAGTLDATLRSCIAQTMTDWVAIVTVDGVDASAERAVAERLADPRVKIECNGHQIGQFGNFNRAILRCFATGASWIKLLCADDVLYPDALERMLAVGESAPRCGLVFGYFDCIDENGQLTSTVDLSGTRSRVLRAPDFLLDTFSRGLFNIIGGPSSVLLDSNVVEHSGLFDDRLNYSGEAVLWFRIVQRYPVGIVGDRPVLQYRIHMNSITGRGFLSEARFAQPVDIARTVAVAQAPFSRLWWLTHRVIGEVLAANALTIAAMLRRGQLGVAFRGGVETARRTTPLAVPPMALALLRNLACLAVGRPPRRIDDLSPRFRSVDRT